MMPSLPAGNKIAEHARNLKKAQRACCSFAHLYELHAAVKVCVYAEHKGAVCDGLHKLGHRDLVCWEEDNRGDACRCTVRRQGCRGVAWMQKFTDVRSALSRMEGHAFLSARNAGTANEALLKHGQLLHAYLSRHSPPPAPGPA